MSLGVGGQALKSKVFIGSSVGGLNVARAIRSGIRHETDPTLWNEGVFRLMSTSIEDLVAASQAFDFAVFIFHPDDQVAIRDQAQFMVRDNVLFELGLFMGSIGRGRCFFVAPQERDDFRIPTDLAGLNPADYDSGGQNIDAAVGDACFRILQVIARVGPVQRETEVTLYSTTARFEPTDFQGVEARIWKGDKPSSHTGRGHLSFPGEGALRVQRDNTDGKFEVHLRPNGPKDPSFARKHEAYYRRLRVRCEASCEGPGHALQFVMKDEERNRWLADQKVDVAAGGWQAIDLHFKVPSDVDLLFRVDDLQRAGAPSAVMIRNLVVTERD
jgi:hypothetical protein